MFMICVVERITGVAERYHKAGRKNISDKYAFAGRRHVNVPCEMIGVVQEKG